MSPSKRVKDFLVKILEEEDQDDRTAQKRQTSDVRKYTIGFMS